MPGINPNKLVEEFKKSGEFERLRKELLAQFQNNEGLPAFKSRIEDVVRQRLTNDQNLLYMPQEFIQRELMQDLDRFPIVESSTSELPLLNSPAFTQEIHESLENIMKKQGFAVQAQAKKIASTIPAKDPWAESRSTEQTRKHESFQRPTSRLNPQNTGKKDQDPNRMDVDG